MPQRIVVVGGSAGALEPLATLVRALPADFPAPVLVVMHLSPSAPSMLAQLLNRLATLPVRAAQHGDKLQPGEVLIAPPDLHLVVREDVVHLTRGPRENRHRPAVDALFNSAARWHGPAVIAVVLSGALDDGAAGTAAIAAQDGTVLVQDPHEAQCSGMPEAALRAVRRARAAPAKQLPGLLLSLVATDPAEQPASGEEAPNSLLRWESTNVDSAPAEDRGDPPGTPAALGCPECQGGMFETEAGGELHYVCYVGHSWSPESLLEAQRDATEAALYNAASKLLEEAAVLYRLAGLTAASENPDAAERAAELRRRAGEAQRRAADIQDMVRAND